MQGGRKKSTKQVRTGAAGPKPGKTEKDLLQSISFFDITPDPVLILTSDTKIAKINPAFAAFFGYTPEDALGRSVFEFVPESEYASLKYEMESTIKTGGMRHFETIALTKKGEKIPVSPYGRAIKDEQGNVICLIASVRDISERKKAEERLAHMHELMQYVISHAQSAIAVHDRDMKYIYVSEQYLRQYNVQERDVIGRHHYDVFPDLPQKWRDVHQRVLAGAVEGKDEDPYVREDGSTDWTRWECRPWFERDGSIGGLIVYTEVITERVKREEALQESESLLRTIAENYPNSYISIIERGLTVGFTSGQEFKKLGLDPKQFVGMTLEQVFGDQAPVVREHYLKTFEGQERSFELYINSQHQLYRTVPLYAPDGSIPRILSVVENITDRKKAEEALRNSEGRLRTLIDAIPDAIFFKDAAGRHMIVNRANERMFGIAPERMVGKTVEELLPAEVAASCRKNDEDVAKARQLVHFDERLFDKDGNEQVLDTIKVPLYDDRGNAMGLVGVIRDVTELKRNEERIRQNEQFIRDILDTVDEGFIVLDRDYRIMTANKAYCCQVGGTCDAIIGRHCYEISHKMNHACHEAGEECAARRVFETGEPSAALHKHPDSDGHILYVETKAYPIKDASGNVISVIETVNNITERHLLEEERLKTQKLESIGTLAGGIAHDFNNLLQGIFGYISMAKLTHDQREKSLAMLEQAEKALHQSVNLTSQLLTFSKGGKPVKKRMSLLPMIENAARFALSGSRSECRITCDPGLWQVEADEGQLGQVIQNIVLNADQAMPLGGSIEITVRNISTADAQRPRSLGARNHVLISIRDSGVGISEHYLTKIFDPYFTTKEKGSGLGLATSYSIIRNHDGLIEVTSAVGKGTTFLIYLPAVEPVAEQTRKGSAPATPIRSGRVLVMDDEQVVRDVIGELLRVLGHETAFAENGEAALTIYREAMASGRPFDIAILDLTIRGGMGGLETVGKLLEADPTAKAIVSSGYSDDAALSNYRALGFKAFLQKPYKIEELRATVSSLLG